LKKETISEEDYAVCQEAWKDHHMRCMMDFLMWYNNRDVVPFLEALQKQVDFYSERHIDMLKDGISVPGLTLKYLFRNIDPQVYYTIYNAKHQDLHWLVKNNIVGGK